MKVSPIRTLLEHRRKPLSRSHELEGQWEELCRTAPAFCLRAIGDANTHVTTKARLLVGLLGGSLPGHQILVTLQSLPDGELLTVLDTLRARRINGRRARALSLRALVGHQRFAELAADHRQRLTRILKHFLGERTWSSVLRFIEHPLQAGDRFLDRVVLRYANDTDTARETLAFLAGLGIAAPKATRKPWLVVPWLTKVSEAEFAFQNESLRRSLAARHSLDAGHGMPRDTLFGIRGTFHKRVPRSAVRRLAAPQPRRRRTDGALTLALKEFMACGNGETSFAGALRRAGSDCCEHRAVDASAAVVLDLSGSSMSSGERLYHPAALGLALVGLLQQRVRELVIFQVGGSGPLDARWIPQPTGETDLATAVLEAARMAPEAIFIVTDGYENVRQGDVAQVVEGLKRLGLLTEVLQVAPVFALAEDLSRRRLGENIPIVLADHETAVAELAARLLLAKEHDDLSPVALRSIEEALFGGV